MIGLGASDRVKGINFSKIRETTNKACLLYTSDAADE